MADNIAVTPGSGATVACDDVGGVLYQRMKPAFGPDGSATDVSSTSPLPIRWPAVSAAAANVNAPAANTAAVVTKAAAGVGVSNVIDGVAWSYSGDPTGGNLKVEDGAGTTVFSIDVTSKGPGVVVFPSPLKGTANTALIVTLAAGGSGISGKVSLLGTRTE